MGRGLNKHNFNFGAIYPCPLDKSYLLSTYNLRLAQNTLRQTNLGSGVRERIMYPRSCEWH